MKSQTCEIIIRNTEEKDFPQIIDLTRAVYPSSSPWKLEQLTSHLQVFPEGQFVAVESHSGQVLGAAASLIVLWDDYDTKMNWRDFTNSGYFTNHDPKKGRTLYGAEVMVHPNFQGKGIGGKIYQARKSLTEKLGLLRIRAGARLRGYHTYANEMSIKEYVIKIIQGELKDPTLSFQLGQDFYVIAIVKHYLQHDPESLGYAAVIEWINDAVAKPEDYKFKNNFLNLFRLGVFFFSTLLQSLSSFCID